VRRAALKLLDGVLRRGQPLEASLSFATRGVDNPADRALAHAIASETLRHLPDLDALIDSATRNRLADDSKARLVIRIALIQVLVLGTPEHAAVATALPLVEGGPRRLVHGVLGTLLRRKVLLPELPTLPEAVAARWQGDWGDAMLDIAATALATPPPLDLTLKDAAATDEWAEKLGGESLAPGHVRVPRGTAIPELPGFNEGAWWVQNIAASIPARVLGGGGGRMALDLCAAPGGKTMQLAAVGWDVTAVDQDRAKLVRLSDNLTRTGLTAHVVQGDILKWQPAKPVSAILLDAPCSATGIFARHPDVLHRVRPRDITALAQLQAAMIGRVAGWLEPGGTLVYATCSLERAEGEAQIAAAQAAGLALKPIENQSLVKGIAGDAGGWIRVLPANHADGFFIAQFVRN
jgi:16S rRNA (cytosine967-C5)-methyltransferase